MLSLILLEKGINCYLIWSTDYIANEVTLFKRAMCLVQFNRLVLALWG